MPKRHRRPPLGLLLLAFLLAPPPAAEAARNCAACRLPITAAYITALGQTWHPEHFTCTACGTVLGGQRHAVHEDKPYCTTCYRQQHTPRCAVCLDPVTQNYLKNYWGDSFCQHHPDELPACYSCKRLVSRHLTGGGVRLSDGRDLCSLCRQTAVDRVDQGRPLMRQVFDALRAKGFDLGDVEVPLRLGGLQDLGVKHGHQTSGRTRTTLHTLDGRVVRREVEEILILAGLPQEHFAAIAAHEYGHAWMFLQKFPALPPTVEEGLCELFAYLWLAGRDQPQAAHQLHMKHHNEDPVYGAGFRAAVAALAHYDAAALVEYVRQHRRFPPAR